MSNKPVFLLVNDDGIRSPFLGPLADHLAQLGEVRVVVPDSEQSWKGKSMTRFGSLRAQPVEGFPGPAFTVNGTPADCVNLGAQCLFPQPPDWVVAGVNIGFNYGLNLTLNSGTVGAAMEAALMGIPAAAFSTETKPEEYGEWVRTHAITGPDAQAMVNESCRRASEMMATWVGQGLPPGARLVSINFPRRLNPNTPVRWTTLLDNRYGPLFSPDNKGGWRHTYMGDTQSEGHAHADVTTVRLGGNISVTALNLDRLSFLPEQPTKF